MKVYRIYNKRTNQYYGSLTNKEGFYTLLESAKRALAQYKTKKWYEVLVIIEFTLENQTEVKE